jgi:uncharacterized membrane protein YphA (DoxX/SURF4 family)
MKNLSILGRILFALPFGIFGLNHFLMVDFFTGMLTSFIPGTGFTVLLTGILLIAASLSIIFRKFVRIACLLLAALLLIFILTIHVPGLVEQGETAQMAMMQLLKDTALMGGALIIASLYEPEYKKNKK